MITPQLYAWKGTKWICRIQFLEGDKLGFWEQNGYSNTAHPWQEDRYSGTQHVSPQNSALNAVFQWMAMVLGISCLLILATQFAGHPEYVKPIQWVSYAAAFGAIPYAKRKLTLG